MIYPHFRWSRFLESSGGKEDSDGRHYPAETRRQVIERARAGTKVAQLVTTSA